jgi:DNA repair exonuclease SbcCD ATPase subunit
MGGLGGWAEDTANDQLTGPVKRLENEFEIFRADAKVQKYILTGYAASITMLKTDLTGVSVSLTGLKADMTAMAGSFTGVKADMTLFAAGMTLMKADVTGLKVDEKGVSVLGRQVAAWRKADKAKMYEERIARLEKKLTQGLEKEVGKKGRIELDNDPEVEPLKKKAERLVRDYEEKLKAIGDATGKKQQSKARAAANNIKNQLDRTVEQLKQKAEKAEAEIDQKLKGKKLKDIEEKLKKVKELKADSEKAGKEAIGNLRSIRTEAEKTEKAMKELAKEFG